MSPTAIVDAKPDSPQAPAPESRSALAGNGNAQADGWLGNHLDAVALVVVTAGFVLRMLAARRNYFNPDELLHYLMINQRSAYLAYRASLTNAHPPLTYFLLYLMHFFSTSEWVLRFPSVIAGTALCWVLYKWVSTIFGKAAGVMGLMIVAFCPAIVALSAEVREYALLLFFETAALYFLALAFQEESPTKMWGFSIFLYLAIITHYSASFFALSVGLYTLARLADLKFPRQHSVAWALGQVGGLALYGFLYVTHLSRLKSVIPAWSVGFDQAYFMPDRVSIFTFTKTHTLNIFLYLFEQRYVAIAMVLSCMLGVAFLFSRDMLSRSADPSQRRLGLLLFLPFLAVWGASLARIYPYMGSRHTVVLAPFAIAAASFFLACLSGKKIWAALLIGALLMGASNATGRPTETGIESESQSTRVMAASMNYIRESVPKGDIIIADYESAVTLSYYLCGPTEEIPADAYLEGIGKYQCAGYSVIPLTVWKLIPQNFQTQFERMARANGLRPGDRVWVFQAGWGENFAKGVPANAHVSPCTSLKSFGDNLAVVPFEVGSDFSPAAPHTGC